MGGEQRSETQKAKKEKGKEKEKKKTESRNHLKSSESLPVMSKLATKERSSELENPQTKNVGREKV